MQDTQASVPAAGSVEAYLLLYKSLTSLYSWCASFTSSAEPVPWRTSPELLHTHLHCGLSSRRPLCSAALGPAEKGGGMRCLKGQPIADTQLQRFTGRMKGTGSVLATCALGLLPSVNPKIEGYTSLEKFSIE